MNSKRSQEHKITLKDIGFHDVRMPRMCDNCVFDQGRLFKTCVHPIAGKVVGQEWRFQCVCRYHQFPKEDI